MRKNREKTCIFVAFAACMLILGSCGKPEERKAVDETNKVVEEQANDIQETTAVEKADLEEVEETNESIIDEESADGAANGASDNDGLLECDIIPCGFYDLDGNKYVMVSTYDDDDSGECMLMFGRYDGADSPFDYYDLENVAKNTYSATNWDKVSVTVTFSDGSMDLSGGTGELEEYNGHYTL